MILFLYMCVSFFHTHFTFNNIFFNTKNIINLQQSFMKVLFFHLLYIGNIYRSCLVCDTWIRELTVLDVPPQVRTKFTPIKHLFCRKVMLLSPEHASKMNGKLFSESIKNSYFISFHFIL